MKPLAISDHVRTGQPRRDVPPRLRVWPVLLAKREYRSRITKFPCNLATFLNFSRPASNRYSYGLTPAPGEAHHSISSGAMGKFERANIRGFGGAAMKSTITAPLVYSVVRQRHFLMAGASYVECSATRCGATRANSGRIFYKCNGCNSWWCSRHGSKGNRCPGCGYKYLV